MYGRGGTSSTDVRTGAGRGGNDITGIQLLLLGWVAKGDALARENDVANARG